MATIPFPLSTAPGVLPGESGGRLINAYVEPAPPGSRSPYIWRRAPGLTAEFTVGAADDVVRGGVMVGDVLYLGAGDKAYSIIADGTVTLLTGTLAGTGPAFFARNMNATPQVLIVQSDGYSQIDTGAGTVADFSDADLPAGNSISFLDGYFFPTIGDGHAYASGVNDVTFAATDKARAESSPDALLRSIPYGRDLLLMGTASAEAFTNTANPTGFPFSRASVVASDTGGPIGLWGKYAVAGWEEGFGGTVVFVGSDNSVRRMNGYTAIRISNPDLEALIQRLTDRDSLEASVYVDRGRPVFVLSSPTWTWECNLAAGASGKWNERVSLGKTRWKARGGIFAFNKWLVFDAESNQVYSIDPTAKREGDDQLVWTLISNQAHSFPAWTAIDRLDFDLVRGVGIDTGIDPIETDPQAQISFSFDGGVHFDAPYFRALGGQGDRASPVTIIGPGMARELGVVVKIVVADPVDAALYGDGAKVQAKAA